MWSKISSGIFMARHHSVDAYVGGWYCPKWAGSVRARGQRCPKWIGLLIGVFLLTGPLCQKSVAWDGGISVGPNPVSRFVFGWDAQINPEQPRPLPAAFALFCFFLFGAVTLKLMNETIKWGRYSVLTCYLGFVTFCIAGVSLFYCFFNFVFPVFREHGLNVL